MVHIGPRGGRTEHRVAVFLFTEEGVTPEGGGSEEGVVIDTLASTGSRVGLAWVRPAGVTEGVGSVQADNRTRVLPRMV